MLLLRLLKESLLFAFNALVVNKLRTVLSLLGITIGIFSIISVFTIVDSLERNIDESIETLGDNVVFIQKWPWSFGSDYAWWEYMNRPVPDPGELKLVSKLSDQAAATAYQASTRMTVRYENNSIEGVTILAVSHDFESIKVLSFLAGRYFSPLESNGGKPVAVLGYNIAANLFAGINPIGRQFKMGGRKVTVIGVLEKEGESLVGSSVDNQLFIPLKFGSSLMDIDGEGSSPLILVKAKEDVSNEALKNEITGIMRSIRTLKPKEDNNFALNETSLLSQSLEGLYGVLNLAGFFIGIFAIIVGGFSIANIMFVSVKERTNIIGIQKSLGAKNYFILLQFLFESVFLCLIGGAIGLLIIFLGTVIAKLIMDFEVALSMNNIITGLVISALIGVVSGIFPAWMASRLNPVDAIRSN